MAQPKISVYSLPDLKNTSDDAIPNYLNSLKFTQSHTLSDTRLAAGYIGFLISAACFYWDYTLTFERTKTATTIAVALYMALNVFLTYWSYFRERNIVYVGTNPAGETVEIATAVKKHIPIYEVTVRWWKKGDGLKNKIEIRRPFSEWFDQRGVFVPQPFQQMFAGEVEVIGRADPAKRITAKGSAAKGDGAEIVDSAVLQETLGRYVASGASFLSEEGTAVKTGKVRRKA